MISKAKMYFRIIEDECIHIFSLLNYKLAMYKKLVRTKVLSCYFLKARAFK